MRAIKARIETGAVVRGLANIACSSCLCVDANMAACANAVLCKHAKELSADAKGALSDRKGGGERMDPDVEAVLGRRRTAVERYKVKVGKFCCYPPNICSWRLRRARGSSESGGAHCPKPRTRRPQSGVGPAPLGARLSTFALARSSLACNFSRSAAAAALVGKVLLARRRVWPLRTYHSNEPSAPVCRRT
jgi:hypothetical protein